MWCSVLFTREMENDNKNVPKFSMTDIWRYGVKLASPPSRDQEATLKPGVEGGGCIVLLFPFPLPFLSRAYSAHCGTVASTSLPPLSTSISVLGR